MKIIILNGSPRKNGATAKILHTLENNLLKFDNVEIEFINLIDKNIQQCRGCCSCYKTGKCFINDDADILSKKIESADGLIIGSPTYASNVSGLLKQFIDRGHFVIEQLLHNKYAISIATGENYGSNDRNTYRNYNGTYLSGVYKK